MKKRILYAIVFTFIPVIQVVAQPGLPSAPEQAPIDGGLTALAAAGGVYFLKKINDRKKRFDDFPTE